MNGNSEKVMIASVAQWWFPYIRSVTSCDWYSVLFSPISHTQKTHTRNCVRLTQSIEFIALIYAGAERISFAIFHKCDTQLHETAFHQNTTDRICHVLFIFIIYLTACSIFKTKKTQMVFCLLSRGDRFQNHHQNRHTIFFHRFPLTVFDPAAD